MKTFAPGLSDSIASVLADPRPCPHCDSSSHIVGDLCVGCLLEAGLDPADDSESESLTEILAEINLPDQNWRLGNYEILEEIGRGGMGVIYRARQRHSRRIVAVKRVLSYHSDSRETLARFRREAQAAASLDHPNILPIYEVSESEDGLPFFSMKFAPGGTLQQVAPALRNDPRQCVALVAKIARAVQYAHSRGILHRDLKPGNILLDGRGEPLVSDFGLAKWLDTTSDLTRTLTIFGTPGYIAPEQASASAADLKPTSDVYSLGAILFDLLAGRPPFLGAHALSVIRQAAELPAPKLRSLSKVADRDLETICSRCLDRDPKLRYPSAHDLAEDLERWLEGRPIIARRVSPPIRVWRWSKRNPVLAAAAVACAALGTAAIIWQAQNRDYEGRLRGETVARHSVAVEALLDLDAVRSDHVLTSALARELRDTLARRGPALVVWDDEEALPPTAARFNQMAPKARTKLLGTTRIRGGKTRLSLRLEDANGNVLYRRLLELDASHDPAGSIAQMVGIDIYTILDATKPPAIDGAEMDPAWRDQAARDLLLAGRSLQERRTLIDLDRAIECFTKALVLQPQSALTHSYLAVAEAGRMQTATDRQYFEAAEKSARKAVELNPKLADAHNALSLVFYEQARFRESLEEIFVAHELADSRTRPTVWAANVLKTLGRPDQAIRWCRLGARRASRPGFNEFMIGDCLSDLGDDDAAAAAYRRALELFPERPEGWMGLCRLALLKHDFDSARQIVTENSARYRDFTFAQEMPAQVEFFSRRFGDAEVHYRDLAAKDPEGGGTFYGAVSYQSALGVLRLLAGETEDGRRILEQSLADEKKALESQPQHPEILYRAAALEAALGHAEPAIAYLNRAFDAGWIDYRSLVLDPRFDSVRQFPKYQEVLDSMATRVASLRRSTPTDELAK
jgi:tetratricopeptide (TPR) repeat protein/tRNA A-37 threonylcarbamoyl transferase component Bud32